MYCRLRASKGFGFALQSSRTLSKDKETLDKSSMEGKTSSSMGFSTIRVKDEPGMCLHRGLGLPPFLGFLRNVLSHNLFAYVPWHGIGANNVEGKCLVHDSLPISRSS